MSIEEVTFSVVASLEALQCDYMLVGAIAAIHYGIARSTFDVDAVIELQRTSLRQLVERLGPGYRLEAQQGFEVFTGKPMHVIQVVNSPIKIDLFPLTDDPFDQERFCRRKRARLRGQDVFLPTAEDVIIQKLRWGRSKDLDDARDIMAVQHDALDWNFIKAWCIKHGTADALDRIRRSIPPT